MERELLILQQGRVTSMPIRGVETREEITYMVKNGVVDDMRKYGMQFRVGDIPLTITPGSTVVKAVSEDTVTRADLISYVTSIFDITDRDVLKAIATVNDDTFYSTLLSTPTRGVSSIDIYPMLRTLSSVYHTPIDTVSTMRSPHDKRLFSLFPNHSYKGDVLFLTDTLSLEGAGVISSLKGMLNEGGTLIITETDYRDEDRDVLYTRMIIDKAAGHIETDDRWYKPRYEWHILLEKEGFIHTHTGREENSSSYISSYTLLSQVSLPIERTYSVPNIMKRVTDIFPLIDGVLPSLSLGINYTVDDLYSLDNPVHRDSHSIYTLIRKKSNTTPPLYIDGGGIGMMIISFTKYGKVSIKTDKVQETLSNIRLYKRGRLKREGSSLIFTMGHREITIGEDPPLLPGSVVITTDSTKEYGDSILYTIVRYDLGTRDREGERHDLLAETVYIAGSGPRSRPEEEFLRLSLIGRIRSTFSTLVVGGDFDRYLFDLITIGQERGILLDEAIPATSSEITPDSLIDMVVNVPTGWIPFIEMMRKDYPNYWESNSKEIAGILPFHSDRRRLAMGKFKEYLVSTVVATISSSLHSYIMSQFAVYNNTIGGDIRVNVTVYNWVMEVTPNTNLSRVTGKESVKFDITEELLNDRSYADIATMLLRHKPMAQGSTGTVDATQLFGSPLSHMGRWRSVYPDIDTLWGSSGSWTEGETDIFVNPPYWNESITKLVSRSVDRKVFVPREFAPKVRGMEVTLV